jgi:hypothetical protein
MLAACGGPVDAHRHARPQIGKPRSGELCNDVVTVARGIDCWADFYNMCPEHAPGIAHQRKIDKGSCGRPSRGGLWNLKLYLKRGKLAHAETPVALCDGLALPDIAADHDTGKGRAQASLINLDLDPADFRLAALDECFPPMHIIFGALGLEFRGLEIGLTGKPILSKLLLAPVCRAFRFQLRFLELDVVLGNLQIVFGLNQFHLQRTVIQLAKNFSRLYRAPLVSRDGQNHSISLRRNVHLVLDRKHAEDIARIAWVHVGTRR